MHQTYPHFHVILLCDSYGADLWPIARRQAPACFAPIKPGSSISLLAATVDRCKGFSEHPLHVLVTPQLERLVYDELVSRVGLDPDAFELLVIPADRGTAFSIALACAHIRRMDSDAVVTLLSPDQYFAVDDRWEQLLYRSYLFAMRNRIVVVGAQQDEACAGQSVIRAGQLVDSADSAFEVRRFMVDMLPAAAQRSVAEGCVWYAGIIVGRAGELLGALKQAEPDDTSQDHAYGSRIADTASFLALVDKEKWTDDNAQKLVEALPCCSFEKLALEYCPHLILLTTTIHITALRSLISLDDALSYDDAHNRIAGDAFAYASSDTTIYGQTTGRVIAALGLHGLMLIDTPDALLVADKTQLTDIQAVQTLLKEHDVKQLDQSAYRPFAWGSATRLFSTGQESAWILELAAGATLEAGSIAREYGVQVNSNAEQSVQERYVVLQGDVLLDAQHAGKFSQIYSRGATFAIEYATPSTIMCVEEAPATLILTVFA